MNKARRARIQKVLSGLESFKAEVEAKLSELKQQFTEFTEGKLSDLQTELDELQSEEQDAFDSKPESLQQSEAGQLSEQAIDALGEASNSVREAIDNFEGMFDADDANGSLDEAIEKLNEIE